MDPAWEPEGELITSPPALEPTATTSSLLPGSHISLMSLSISHTNALYNSIGGIQNGHLFKYIPMNPFLDHESFYTYMKTLLSDLPFFAFAIVPTSSPSTPQPSTTSEKESVEEDEIKALGIMSLSNIAPEHRTIEIGMIYSSLLQRTTEATECVYLLMRHCFEDLGYLRVEWKCSNANEQSKRAAIRFGFVFEGLLRRHLVVKGRSRDTAWYSVIKEEWGVVGKSLELWLEEGNFDEGRQRRKLEEVRDEVRRGRV